MQAKDVIRQMGRFPDAINPTKREPKMWTCSQCGYKHPVPAFTRDISPCECGSIFWEIGGNTDAR